LETDPVSRTGWRARRYVAVLLGLMTLSVGFAWTQRKPIASDYIDDELARRGVAASYEIADLGLRRQRLENIRIGDPANPDLTADWAEIDMVVGFGGPVVRAVRASGVRVRGRLVDGRLSLGAVDRLLPAPSGAPFAFPEIHATIRDGRMRLETPAGLVGLALDGRGYLPDGFRGRLSARAPVLTLAGCRAVDLRAGVGISTDRGRPAINGPITLAGVTCGSGFAIDAPRIDLNGRLAKAMNGWDGSVRVAAPVLRQGESRLTGVAASARFAGNAGRTQGDVRMTARTLSAAGVAGEGLTLSGQYALAAASQGVAVNLDGNAALDHLRVGAQRLAAIDRLAAGARGTPVGPLVDAVAVAAIRAGGNASGRTAFSLRQRDGAGSLALGRLALTSASGARVELDGAPGIRLRWPDRGLQIDGRMRLGGGGFPDAEIFVAQPAPGGPITGEARIAPFAANGARLALAPVLFSADGGATRFRTRVTLDGPVGDGAVRGLTMPVDGVFDGQGGYRVNRGCTPVAFRSLALAGMVLDPARFSLCAPVLLSSDAPFDARIANPRLTGTLGGSPLTLAASRVRIANGVTLGDVSARLGEAGRVSRLDFDSITATAALSGRFTGGSGAIANVPLLMSDAGGTWRLAQGVLTVAGDLQVADAAADPRFQPLRSTDFALRLEGGRITAGGTLRAPQSGVAVTTVDIAHDLGRGTGRAVLDVPGVTFGEALQPEAITRLALGVVANVVGTVSGRGDIRWSPESVTSDGVFRTSDMSLAAAFGPVTGLSTEMRFTDLLALETAPGQVATLKTVNPGLLVEDGVIRYQLLAGQQARIEGGTWPFAGGELILEPTLLDFGRDTDRRMTFRVVGLDAARFINQMEFENIAATGLFDGTIPMVFDGTGGRIENGSLVVRPGGGTLAYVGEVSNADLGMFAKLAFDALKSIRYDRLTIDLNGAIDGEMVTQVRFNGVNQGTLDGDQAGFFREFIGLPFLFNIKISAPFRGLLTTARSFTDPSILIRDSLPPDADAESVKPVQPQDSETMR
jgi:translocation and assembly module TamB